MKRTKKIIPAVMLCESFTNRSNILVMMNNAQNERERKQTSPYAKVGRIAGQTIRGWLRHAMEKLLLENGVSVCHPLSSISIRGGNSSKRNQEYYDRDLSLGYHPRGECAEEGGCLIYQLFGDLNIPGNLIVPSAYFYPTTTGNGSATTGMNKVFGSIGGGRVELTHVSPRARDRSHQTYMSMETVVGVMIETPLNLILVNENPAHEVVLLKALEYLKVLNQEYEFDHLLGGMRGQGYGRAAILPKVKMKKPTKDPSSADEEDTSETDETDEEAARYRIQFKLTKKRRERLEREFQSVLAQEKVKFPLPFEPKASVKEKSEEVSS